MPVAEGFLGYEAHKDCVTILVAEERATGTLVGVTVGVDHHIAFNDPDNGSTLWALAVDKQAKMPGVGPKLVESLATHFPPAGRSFKDVSVTHDHQEALALYQKMASAQLPVDCL